jgi:uncharacterized protein
MKRILCIDGGGIKGVFPAAVLSKLEKNLDRPIAEYFDLIAGTSTGGIIAIGLAMRVPASDILKLYEDQGPDIFNQTRPGLTGWTQRKLQKIRWIFKHKYSSTPLKQALEDVFADKTLGDAKNRLLIPAWHSLNKEVYVFKTAHHERLRNDYKEKVVDVALATAAAPTFFKQHKTASGVSLVDGGIWANNPTGFAVVEALGVLGWKKEDIHVLSLSCLDEVGESKKSYGVSAFAPKMADWFISGQSKGSLGIAHILTGDPHERKAIHRVTKHVPEGFYALDNTAKIENLKDRAFAEARNKEPELREIFFKQPAEPFKPIYGANDD